MAARKVFIIWKHPLFHETVRALLNHPELVCIGSSSEFSADQLLSDTPPDIIVIEEENHGQTVRIINLLLNHYAKIRLLALNLLDNEMSVFDYSFETVYKVNDFLSWVLEESSQMENDK
jgi:DNA-binding NarL/FixJ family response regulator